MHLSSFTDTGIVLLLLIIFMLVCIKTGKLSLPASLAAGVVGFLVFAGAGFTGICMLGAFFLLSVLATAHRKDLKAKVNTDGLHPEKRNAGQVFANGGTAALMAIPVLTDPAHASLYTMMLAASLASATADTLSSELGTVYGRNFYNILTFKKDTKGLDGVISLEGTLIGIAGALVIAVIYSCAYDFDKRGICILWGGIIGNLVDSILGASLERKHYINNNVVNFLNTLFAALIALLLYRLF